MVSERRSDPASLGPDSQLLKALKRIGGGKDKDLSYTEVLQHSREASAAIREKYSGATLRASSGYQVQQALRNEVMKDQRKLHHSSNNIGIVFPSGDSASASASELALEATRTSDSAAPRARVRRSTSGASERTCEQLGVYQVDLSLMHRGGPDAGATPSRRPACAPMLQPTSPQSLASPNRMNFIINQTPPASPTPFATFTQPTCLPALYSRSHDPGSSSALKSSLGIARPSPSPSPSSSRPSSTTHLPPNSPLVRLPSDYSSSSLHSLHSPTGSAALDSPSPKPRPRKSSSGCSNAIRNAAEQSKRPDLLLHQLLIGNQGNTGRSPSPLTSPNSPKVTERRTLNPAGPASPSLDSDPALRPMSSISAGQLSGRLFHAPASPGSARQLQLRPQLLAATSSNPSIQL